MRDIILDIRKKLENDLFIDEQHVRFSLVARLCQALGWNVWNPDEFYTEYPVKKFPENEKSDKEKGKVDVALFLNTQRGNTPEVYIEVKRPRELTKRLNDHEKQLSRYNYHDKSAISVLTDGLLWRFYLPSAGGTFQDRMFSWFHFLSDSPERIEHILQLVLSRNNFRKKTLDIAEEMLADHHHAGLINVVKPEAERMAKQLGDSSVTLIAKLLYTKHNLSLDETTINRLLNNEPVPMPVEQPVQVSVAQTPEAPEPETGVHHTSMTMAALEAEAKLYKDTKPVRVYVIDTWFPVKKWSQVKQVVYNRVLKAKPDLQFTGHMKTSTFPADFAKAMPLDNGQHCEGSHSIFNILRHSYKALTMAGYSPADNLKIETTSKAESKPKLAAPVVASTEPETSLQDVPFYTGKKPSRMFVVDTWYDVKTWKEVKQVVYNYVLKTRPNMQFSGPLRMVSENEKSAFIAPMPLSNGLYCECSLSAAETIRQCKKALKQAGFNPDNSLRIEVKEGE